MNKKRLRPPEEQSRSKGDRRERVHQGGMNVDPQEKGYASPANAEI